MLSTRLHWRGRRCTCPIFMWPAFFFKLLLLHTLPAEMLFTCLKKDEMEDKEVMRKKVMQVVLDVVQAFFFLTWTLWILFYFFLFFNRHSKPFSVRWSGWENSKTNALYSLNIALILLRVLWRPDLKGVDPCGGCVVTYAGLVLSGASRCKTDMSLSFSKPW